MDVFDPSNMQSSDFPPPASQTPDYESLVRGIYRDELLRDVDPEGLANWSNFLAAGMSPDQVRSYIRQSPEYQLTRGQPTSVFDSLTQAPATSQGTDYGSIVRQIYQDELLRDVDPEGLATWSRALAGGMSPDEVRSYIRQSPEYAALPPRPFSSMDPQKAAEIVSRVYQSEFGREANDPGADYWRGQLTKGLLDEAGFLSSVRQSPEYTGTAVQQYGDVVRQAYQKEFGRDPDPKGLEYWSSQLRSGQATVDMLPSLFAGSSEGFVVDQYEKYLGRMPTGADASGWVKALETGEMSPYQVAAGIRRSEEARLVQDAKNKAATAPAEEYVKTQMQAAKAAQEEAVKRGAFAPSPLPTGVVPSVFQMPTGDATQPAPATGVALPPAQTPPPAQATTPPAAQATTPPFGGFFQPTQIPQATQPEPFPATPINVPVFGPAPLPTRGSMPEVPAPEAFNPFPDPFQYATPATIYSPNFFGPPKTE